MRLIVNGTLDLAPMRRHYSPALCDLVQTLLCKTPHARPSFRTLLQHQLIRTTLAALGTPPPTPPAPSAYGGPPTTPSATAPHL